MKNFIIGYGETLTSKVEVKPSGGGKSHPYSFLEAKDKIIADLTLVVDQLSSKPNDQGVNGEFVVKFIQHPSYLAKSYYPTSLFSKYKIKDIGSRPLKIKPRKWAIKKHPEEGLTSCIYVSGSKEKFENMLFSLRKEQLNDNIKNVIRSLEEISFFPPEEKVKSIVESEGLLKLEVVLHASKDDDSVRNAFNKYADSICGEVDWERAKSVGGLTFIPVSIGSGSEYKLAEFSHLRVLRSMPKLRLSHPEVLRNTLSYDFQLPEFKQLNNDFKVCIFDGGIGSEHALHDWVTEYIPEDIKSSHPVLFAHGSEVCSTYLFGPYQHDSGSFGEPYTTVDIVRVLSPDDTDPDLFDVLTRIERVLEKKEYKYVNLSLGPRMAVDDDEVHVWTSVIDKLLEDGHCFATVAIGNDGDLDEGYSRIQPPSDMVNCFSVGAINSTGKNWQKAPYSCIGPGRSPGLIKPDGVIFGGSNDELFTVYSPLTHSLIGTAGTSYAAPYALRVAAGVDAITDMPLNVSTVKALMIHHAKSEGRDQREVGWGRLPDSPVEIVECMDDEAIIVYQGQLKKSEHLRIPIPIPEEIDCTWVHLKATFCFTTATDPEHPLHYTRSGLEVVFRANEMKIKEGALHPESNSFFALKKLYETEEGLRDDAHKWETSISRSRRFQRKSLVNPVFDVKYHAREQGGDSNEDLMPLNYSLVVSIRTEGNDELYNLVLQQNQTLLPVQVATRIRV